MPQYRQGGKKERLALVPELRVGSVQSRGCAFWKLSSGRITGPWFSRDAILPGGAAWTLQCDRMQDCLSSLGTTKGDRKRRKWTGGGVTVNEQVSGKSTHTPRFCGLCKHKQVTAKSPRRRLSGCQNQGLLSSGQVENLSLPPLIDYHSASLSKLNKSTKTSSTVLFLDLDLLLDKSQKNCLLSPLKLWINVTKSQTDSIREIPAFNKGSPFSFKDMNECTQKANTSWFIVRSFQHKHI